MVDPVVLEIERIRVELAGNSFDFAVVVGGAAVGGDHGLFEVRVVEVGAAVVALLHRLLLLTPRLRFRICSFDNCDASISERTTMQVPILELTCRPIVSRRRSHLAPRGGSCGLERHIGRVVAPRSLVVHALIQSLDLASIAAE